MLPIYRVEQIKAWDELTTRDQQISSTDLMERAASAFTRHLLASNLFTHAYIFCGTGNNGGDGLVTARLLHDRGKTVTVFIVGSSNNYSPDFKINLKRLPPEVETRIIDSDPYTLGIQEVLGAKTSSTGEDFQPPLIIDAIFGSGLNREPEGRIAQVIEIINASPCRVVSIDIPSGLFATDNRSNVFHTVQADQTLTFQSPKMAFLFEPYARYVGDLTVVNIGLTEHFHEQPVANLITKSDIRLKDRETFSHKGDHGFLLVVAGFEPYFGAAALTARAAQRAGCGYTAVHCHRDALPALLGTSPECIFVPETENGFPPKTSAIAIGPGLGTDAYATALLEKALGSSLPLVIDADGLNILAARPELLNRLPEHTILTPHLKELERLVGPYDSPEELLEKQVEFSKKYSAYVIQKGAYSKLTAPTGEIFINSSGNPGMATSGMGDVLTGITGSLLAQGFTPLLAATYGMFIHGYAADLIKRQRGERGMVASDVINAIPQALNDL